MFLFIFSIFLFSYLPVFGQYDNNELIASFPSKEDNFGIVPAAMEQRNFGSSQQLQRSKNQNQQQNHHQKHHRDGEGHRGENVWGYEDHDGPHSWGTHCRHGTRQSPIDIRTSSLEFAYINELHFVNYELSGAVELKNNGHGVEITGFEKWGVRQRPYIYGGGLSGRSQLAQFHFHWANEHNDGSEHTLNALHYPMELHLVHVKDGYSFSEAKDLSDGLSVVGVFYHIGKDGSAMANLESGLKRVQEKEAATLIFNYTVGVHLPVTTDNFYRYHGSLTTPDCNEAVIWTIMAEPVPILAQQLALLRAIQGPTYGQHLSHNVRPVQSLNGRRVQFRSSTMNRLKICSNETIMAKPSGNGLVEKSKFPMILAMFWPMSLAIIFT